MAPFNPRILHEAGIEFAFTASRGENFLRDLRYAVAYGLPERVALEAITTVPASWLNVQDEVGTLEPGKRAIFNVFSNNIFQSDAKLIFQFSEGSVYEFDKSLPKTPFGKYRFNSDLISGDLEWLGETREIKIDDSTSFVLDVKWSDGLLNISFQPNDSVFYRASGWGTSYGFAGVILNEYNEEFEFEMTEVELFEAKPDSVTVEEYVRAEIPSYHYPFVGFGREEQPRSESVLIRNATLWTNTDRSVMVGDIRFANGKVVEVGENLGNQKGERVIDGTGKHVTPGIVDEHSHIALSGVNEGSMNSSAEVRMRDAVDSEDINIYRQLSGGVVAAQLLHGSANPIGGQSAIVKFKWGAPPSEMLIEGSDPFIKFALGENVKQSNWGDDYTTRFPQTRMGVEQVFRDAFTRAVAYRESWDKYNQLSSREKRDAIAPRRDLELEALAEIVYGERFISCHSYVQSEINMLMKVAEEFGFVVNTFTHILEGYKVAHIMAEHGAGGSTFSDWWAYKYEVRDAIPYNAAAMHDKGVVVAINSDDAEMGRRLNQEAAKSVKYGGMSPEDVIKMITLNPAKLLHLDDQMGSLEAGKSADIVLWSGDPLSISTKAEITWVDGVPYFDRKEDQEMREALRLEKARLIQAMLRAKENGQPVQPVYKKDPHLWHCDDLTEIYR
jgi:imidazolonepropionase-like amidohydrolase